MSVTEDACRCRLKAVAAGSGSASIWRRSSSQSFVSFPCGKRKFQSSLVSGTPRACYLVLRARFLSQTSVLPCLAPRGQQALEWGAGLWCTAPLSFHLLLQGPAGRPGGAFVSCAWGSLEAFVSAKSFSPRKQCRLSLLSAQLLLPHSL